MCLAPRTHQAAGTQASIHLPGSLHPGLGVAGRAQPKGTFLLSQALALPPTDTRTSAASSWLPPTQLASDHGAVGSRDGPTTQPHLASPSGSYSCSHLSLTPDSALGATVSVSPASRARLCPSPAQSPLTQLQLLRASPSQKALGVASMNQTLWASVSV